MRFTREQRQRMLAPTPHLPIPAYVPPGLSERLALMAALPLGPTCPQKEPAGLFDESARSQLDLLDDVLRRAR